MVHNGLRNMAWRLLELWETFQALACLMVALLLCSPQIDILQAGLNLASQIRISDVLWLAGIGVIWHFVMSAAGLYRNRRLSSFHAELIDVAKATVGILIVYIIYNLLLPRTPVSARFVALFWALTTLILGAGRGIIRLFLVSLRLNNRNLRYLLIIGTNERARSLGAKITNRRELGYRFLGYCDELWEGLDGLESGEYPRLVCNLETVSSYLRDNVVDEVFIALPIRSFYSEIRSIIAVCEEQGIRVRMGADLFETTILRAEPEILDGTPTIAHHPSSLKGWKAGIKRMADITWAICLIIVFAPVMIAAALAVKLTSAGPVLFSQNRLGLNKRIFKMYKFRTMIKEAESLQDRLQHRNEVSGPVFKIADDPRVTRVGRFLRKTSIDELPQLFNVLKGDMSLIGPRPLPLRDYRGFENDAFKRRMSVLPGITCLWQAGGRSTIPFERWMQLDLEYIDHWSFRLDARILMRTAIHVLRQTGAV